MSREWMLANIEERKNKTAPYVDLRKMPPWFRSRLRKLKKDLEKECRESSLLTTVNTILSGGQGKWLDHTGMSKLDDGTSEFVSEPYWVTWEDCQKIQELASAIGCKWVIRGDANWFHRCCSVIIYEG